MKTIERIYPSRIAFEITQDTSRLFTDKGKEAVISYCKKYNLKERFCNTCQMEAPTIRTPNNCVCTCCNQSVTIDSTEKSITQNLSWYQHYKMTQEAGYDDLDIKGYDIIHRACVPHDITIGDIFNIYLGESTKNGCIYLGTLDQSLSRYLFEKEMIESGKIKWQSEPSLSERIRSLELYRDTRNRTLPADNDAYERTEQQIRELKEKYYE